MELILFTLLCFIGFTIGGRAFYPRYWDLYDFLSSQIWYGYSVVWPTLEYSLMYDNRKKVDPLLIYFLGRYAIYSAHLNGYFRGGSPLRIRWSSI